MPREIEVKSVLNRAKSRDSWFLDDYTINLYSSCSFNCLYCYIRGSKYGTNLETSLSAKVNAIEVLDRQLHNRAKKGQYGIIVMSSATDPWLQIEKQYQLTREALKVILRHRFPLHVITKSDLVTRDFDLLKEIERAAILPSNLSALKKGLIVSFSFSTVSDEIGVIFEPGATRPSARLEAVKASLEQGFLTGISMMPLLPFISDTTEQLQAMFSTMRQAGVDYVLPATLTLFGNEKADSKTLVINAVRKHFPELEAKYQKFFAQGSNMPAYYQSAFYRKMEELCREHGLSNGILKAAAKKYGADSPG